MQVVEAGAHNSLILHNVTGMPTGSRPNISKFLISHQDMSSSCTERYLLHILVPPPPSPHTVKVVVVELTDAFPQSTLLYIAQYDLAVWAEFSLFG